MPGVLSGLIPACHTPFQRDGELNLAVVERQAALFRETGLRSVFIAGTTGEFASLTLDERKALCERWMEVAGDTLRVAVHVGDNCLSNAVELAAHARKAGVAAIALAPPSYFKPASVQDLVDFCVPIAAEIDPLPFYYYHIPGMTGVRLPMAEFLYEARFRIPNLCGLKFSHDDLVDLQGCVTLENGAYDVLPRFRRRAAGRALSGRQGSGGKHLQLCGPTLSQTDASLRVGGHADSESGPVRSHGNGQSTGVIRLHGCVEGRDVVDGRRLWPGPATDSQPLASPARRAGRQAGAARTFLRDPSS